MTAVKEYVPNGNENFMVDSILGYTTFAADNSIEIVPREISAAQFDSLYTFAFLQQEKFIEPGNRRFTKLKNRFLPAKAQTSDDNNDFEIHYISHFPKQHQYCFHYEDGPNIKGFMVSEDGVIDSTSFHTDYFEYNTSLLMATSYHQDCDFTCDLQFYRYNSEKKHMEHICHYLDYRFQYQDKPLPKPGKKL